MKKILLASLVLLFTVFGGCKKNDQEGADKLAPGVHKIVAKEVIPVNAYVYVKGLEGDKEVWMAFPKQPVTVGAELWYSKYMEMEKFTSPELKRTFDKILFVEDISNQPIVAKPATAAPQSGMGQQPQKPTIEKQDVKVEKAAGGITIAQLYANTKSYENKTVKIKGKVVKYNGGIMNKNWVHIQDGTGSADSFDLTVTTDSEVKVGDVVVFEGKIALNKDFGYGYSYKVLLEEAKIAK